MFRSCFLNNLTFLSSSPRDQWLSWSRVPVTGHEIALAVKASFHVFVVYTPQGGPSPLHSRLTLFTSASLVIQHHSEIVHGRNHQFLMPYLINNFLLPPTLHQVLWNFTLHLGKNLQFLRTAFNSNFFPVVFAFFLRFVLASGLLSLSWYRSLKRALDGSGWRTGTCALFTRQDF